VYPSTSPNRPRLFAHLGRKTTEERELTADEIAEQEAQAKKDRIKFHREQVRNGPRKFSYVTSGQQRRFQARGQAAQRRKMNRRYRRDWMRKQAELATLRGHLTILGVIECRNEAVKASGFAPSTVRESCVWAIRKYGERDDEGNIVQSDTLLDDAVAAARKAFLDSHQPVSA
jgi:hypothetical protein